MVGAGQLARMTHQAAVDLDVELVVVAESPTDPAVLAGASHLPGGPADREALFAAAGEAPVVTFDHELVPAALLAELDAAGVVMRPGPTALAFAQDKLHARRELAAGGYPVPVFAPVAGPGDISAFATAHGWPVVLKARSGGYDGRGVAVLAGPADIPDLPVADWGTGEQPAWLVEEHLEFAAELAAVVARRPSGQSVAYPLVRTTQVDGICRHLVAPAGVPAELDEAATGLALELAGRIGAVGITAVELFVTTDGRLLVNELALRPHNSAHATIEACVTSQFHNHLRAVLDWPLGCTDLVAPAAAMVNLITPDADADPAGRLPAALGVPGASVHLYAKTSRPGRKVGHVTALAESPDAALGIAQAAADILLVR